MTKSYLPFPPVALDQHVIALGKTRSGKSSKLRVIVEYLLDKEKAITIIDKKGDWWGLKSDADGKHAGYPIVIFGGKHADVPLNPRAGAAVAELLAGSNRPAIFDLKGWSPSETTRFYIDFVSKTFQLQEGGQRYLAIPEVHNFAPKGRVLSPQVGEMLHWTSVLAAEGQGMGLILLLDSQRGQKVHNDVLSSCETLIACRVIHAADRGAIKEWIDGNGDAKIGQTMLGELANMPRTDAYVWSPESEFGPERITWRMFQTFDSFKPQPPNQKKLQGWADVDLEEVKGKLATVIEEQKANDPAELKREIAALKKQLSSAPVKTPVSTGVKWTAEDLKGAEKRGFETGVAKATREWKEWAKHIRRATHEAVDTALKGAVAEVHVDHIKWSDSLTPPAKPAQIIQKSSTPAPARAVTHTGNGSGDRGELQPVQARILDALAELEQMGARQPDRTLVAFMAGYSNVTSKGFANAIGALKTADLVGYPGDGSIVLTPAGQQIATPSAAPRTPEELQQRLIAMLGGASGRILQPLIEHYPKSIARGDLAVAAGYGNVTSKGFANAIGRLSGLGFIEYPEKGQVAAKPVLFLEGA